MKIWEKVLVSPQTPLREAIARIDAAGTQMALVVDEQRRLLGTLSDGDIRRGLLKGLDLSDAVEQCMYRKPTTIAAGTSDDAALSLMRRRGLHHLPVVDDEGVVVGLRAADDFFVARTRDNWVVVMAGGLGTRLRELTRDTPKPMLHVGERPLLETILRGFIDQGFRRFYLSVNYKAELIEQYFGDGSSLGAEIRYLREKQRLGTAGALSLLPETPTAPIIVTNGDLLAKVDFVDMIRRHEEHGAAATMAVREYEFQIPYGVVSEDDGRIERIEEKPIHRSLVSAGMYVLSAAALQRVPADTQFDMPSLFDTLIAEGQTTRAYTVRGYWLDIGRLPDYEKAKLDYAEVFR